MDVQRAIAKIQKGLTGDPTKDAPYLAAEFNKYQTKAGAEGVLFAIAAMMQNLLPDKEDGEFGADAVKLQQKINECDAFIEAGQLEKALKTMDECIALAHEIVDEDPDDGFFSYNAPFEAALYQAMISEDAETNATTFPISQLYQDKAQILFGLERYAEAREVITDALHWNPVDAISYLDDADLLTILEDNEEAWDQVVKGYSFAYNRPQLSRVFVSAAHLLARYGKMDDSIALLETALAFTDDPESQNDILSGLVELGVANVGNCDMDELAKVCEKYGFEFGAKKDIVRLALRNGEAAEMSSQYDAAYYYYGIAYDLTYDDGLKKHMKKLKPKCTRKNW